MLRLQTAVRQEFSLDGSLSNTCFPFFLNSPSRRDQESEKTAICGAPAVLEFSANRREYYFLLQCGQREFGSGVLAGPVAMPLVIPAQEPPGTVEISNVSVLSGRKAAHIVTANFTASECAAPER